MIKKLIQYVKDNKQSFINWGLIAAGTVAGLVATGVLVSTLSDPEKAIDDAVEAAVNPEI